MAKSIDITPFMDKADLESGDDSDSAVWRGFRNYKKHKHEVALTKFLQSDLPNCMTKHTDYHYSITIKGERVDYWPSANKWRWRARNLFGDIIAFQNWLTKQRAPSP